MSSDTNLRNRSNISISLGEVEAMESGEGFAWLSFWSVHKTAGIFHCLTLLIDLTLAY